MPATATKAPTRVPLNRLTRRQVDKIVEAEAKVTAAKRRLEEAREEREAVRDRYRGRLPEGKGIEAGGYLLKRIIKSTGRRFRLSEYLRQHKLTAAMKPFVSQPGSWEQWDVKPIGK